ncbi:MAG: sulfate adenylyltransferase subunit CysD [Ilumatobacteraceae bacterium]
MREGIKSLEDESIAVIREVAASFERPVILFSGGKDSVVVLHAAIRAFAPAVMPFTVMHVDTGHNFREVIEFRDRIVAKYNLDFVVASVQEAIDAGKVVDAPSRNPLQTVALLDAIEANKFDAVIGGARRDEDRARAKERIFSHRDTFGQWDPKNQRPELWNIFNTKHLPNEHFRVFPISNWTELDVWTYIQRHNIDLPSIYFAHERDVFRRDGMWMAVTDFLLPEQNELVERRSVRFRTVGDATCTAAVESTAATIEDIISETAVARVSERGATRADDRISAAGMEDRKRQGYF